MNCSIPLAQHKALLVVRLGAIGDVLRTIPAVRRLRREAPSADIAWVVEDWVAPILEGNPNITRLHVLSRRELDAGGPRAWAESRRLVREIRARRYDMVLDFHGRFKSGLISLLSGSKVRLGFARGDSTEGNFLFSNFRVKLADTLESRVLRFLHLLGPLGIDTSFDADDTGIHVRPELKKKAEEWHRGNGSPGLALYPGCSAKRLRYHRWPNEKWVELIRRLSKAGVASVVFWGPSEEAVAKEIVSSAGEASCILAPRTGVADLMAMISQFKAFLGYNTGAMHMAWLQGVPTAVFTGPVQERTDSPLPPVPFRILRAEELYRAGTSKKLQAGVTSEVPVESAYRAAMELIG